MKQRHPLQALRHIASPASFLFVAFSISLLLSPAAARAQDNLMLDRGRIGIDVQFDRPTGYFAVTHVLHQGPAAQAGVHLGDLIVAIGGTSTHGLTIGQVRTRSATAIGATVRMTIRIPGTADREITTVERSIPDVYLPAATEGDAFAESRIGYYYEYAPGSQRDISKALSWYQQAAAQGDPTGEFHLGRFYMYGSGVKKDEKTAAAFYRGAAFQGYAIAERYLAECYYYGTGVARSYHDAFAWYYAAAGAADDPIAEKQLGYAYQYHTGVDQSYRDAFNWFYAASMHDNAESEQFLGYYYRNGKGVAIDDNASFAWYYRSAINGDPYGQWGLAYMYQLGRGVAKSDQKALAWYQTAYPRLQPDDARLLTKPIASLSLRLFMHDRRSVPRLDLQFFVSAYHQRTITLLLILGSLYFIGGGILMFFTLRGPGAPLRLPAAIGWILFFVEGEAFGALALFATGAVVNMAAIVGATCACGPLPIIGSSLGPARARLWKRPAITWQRFLLLVAGIQALHFLFEKSYTLAFARITGSHLQGQSSLVMIGKLHDDSPVLAYLFVAVLFPIAEEVVFRGYLFESLQRRLPGGVVILITGLVFGAAHMDWPYFIPLAFSGFMLGWARLKSGSLHLSVALHILNNTLATAFLRYH